MDHRHHHVNNLRFLAKSAEKIESELVICNDSPTSKKDINEDFADTVKGRKYSQKRVRRFSKEQTQVCPQEIEGEKNESYLSLESKRKKKFPEYVYFFLIDFVEEYNADLKCTKVTLILFQGTSVQRREGWIVRIVQHVVSIQVPLIKRIR